MTSSRQCPKCFKDVLEIRLSIVEGAACPDCSSMLQKAKAEPKRRCLQDDTEMQKDLIGNVIIDRCSACGGVWLDGGEMDAIKENLQNFQTVKNWAYFFLSGITLPG
jgi:Zn-finger nucleic acid-binding protein